MKVKLEWARPLLDLDPSAHLDREDDVSTMLAGGERLLELLAETRTVDEACALLAKAMLARPASEAPATPALALDLVRQTTGRVRVDAVARGMGVSLRQLRRAVRAETAISLKAYARITRLNHAMALADRATRPGLGPTGRGIRLLRPVASGARVPVPGGAVADPDPPRAPGAGRNVQSRLSLRP